MRILAAPLLALAVCWPAAFAAAQPAASAEATATNAGAAPLPAAQDVNECFDRWLATQQGMSEGANQRPAGTLFIARGVAELSSQRGTSQWMVDRQASFTRAELSARATLARFIGEEVNSGRVAEIFQGGTDAGAPPPRPVTEQVSLAARLSTLAGAQLDDAIRQFNPTWTGGNVTEEERKAQAAREQVTVQTRVAARAQLFAAGALTAHQCEGLNADGRYTVVVAMMWSLRLQEIAESITDPARARPAAPTTPLAEQFRVRTQDNPTWLSTTMGVRVWTNEKGERVVVGFGAVGGSSSASIDEDRARLQALGAIQRFVGEKVEVRDTENGQFVARENTAGDRQVFDNQAFESRIEARSKTVRLQGIATMQRWRGKHPWADTPMQVVVLVWTPSGGVAAEAVRQEVQQGEQRLRAGAGTPPSGGAGQSGPVGAPTRSGASSSAADF
jgi:hypothetical protein